jgi:glyoxalase family protein
LLQASAESCANRLPSLDFGADNWGRITFLEQGVWLEWLFAAKNVSLAGKEERMGETVLTFSDPDGMKIELVGHAESAELKAPRFADVPVEHAIRGFFGVTMLQRDARETEAALALLGFRQVAEEANRLRFSAAGDSLGNHIDILVNPKVAHGAIASTTLHSVRRITRIRSSGTR